MITRILPGTSVEVIAGSRNSGLSTVGVVAMPLPLSWGDTVTILQQGENPLASLGYEINDPALKLVKEVLMSARKLILYRLNTGSTKASKTIVAGITATARFGGIRGNDIKVTVEASGESWVIKTFLDTVLVDSQVVTAIKDFVSNAFITISGTGTLSEASVTLTGGTDATEDNGVWPLFFAELEKRQYNIIAYTGTDSATAQGIVDFVNNQRENDVNVQLVQSVLAANNKAVYKSTIGGKTADYTLTAAEACATLAGILAKQGIEGSATYFDVPWWTDVSQRLTRTEQELKTGAGETLFVYMHGGVKVLYDINSLTTFTADNPEDFRKGLVVRTLDKIATDLKVLLDTRAIGKIRNSVDGRNQIKGFIVSMIKPDYLDKGYIDGFTADDVAVAQAKQRDSIVVTVGIKVTDTVDKIYITVTAL